MNAAVDVCKLRRMEDLAERIRTARERAGLNQSELARAMNPTVSPQTVQQWEKGGGVRQGKLPSLARALGVTVEWLLFGDAYQGQKVTLVTPSPHGSAATLNASTVSAAYTGLRWRFQLAGLDYDLARDPELFVLAYAWAMNETTENMTALKQAIDAKIAALSPEDKSVGSRPTEPAHRGDKPRASPRKR